MSRLTTLLFLCAAVTGCAGLHPASPPGHARTVQTHGGLCPHDACRERARETLARLIGRDHHLQVQVVGSASPRAFAWSSGHLLVSCGLTQDPADDALLAAALAHECGHLLDDGHMAHHAPATLTHGPAHAETRADRIGVQLLARAGYDPAAMARLLADLEADPSFPPAQQSTLRERMANLRAAGLAGKDLEEQPHDVHQPSPGGPSKADS